MRDGKLDPTPVAGTPPKVAVLEHGNRLHGRMDIAPRTPTSRPTASSICSIAAARGTWLRTPSGAAAGTDKKIVDGQDIFLSDDVDALYSAHDVRPRRELYFTIGCPGVGTGMTRLAAPQHPDDFAGKTLRLNDDGTIPNDNPSSGGRATIPRSFTLGHRRQSRPHAQPVDKEFWSLRARPQWRR